MSKTYKIVIAAMCAVILIFGGFLGGFFTSNSLKKITANVEQDTKNSSSTHGMGGMSSSTTSLTLNEAVDATYQLMKKSGYKVPTEQEAITGTLNGLLKSAGDQYSRYLPAKEFSDYTEEMNGQFGGVGVVLEEKDGTTYVSKVYPKTPAARAGVKAGDVFKTIAGKTSDKWTTSQVQKLARGEAGTKVTITFLRPWGKGEHPTSSKEIDGKTYTVTMTREMIFIPNTEARMVGNKVGYIRLGEFNAQASKDIKADIDSLTKKGAKSFILDLRENPGGLVTEAVNVASLFIKDGTIVSTAGRDNKVEEVLKANGKTATDLPLVVLIDENSASASEIVTGALQDHKRATIVGTKSFGKGSVQTQIPLDDGSAIIMTIQHYQTPSGKDINKKGLTPDITVKMDVMNQSKASTDTQLKRAIQEAQKLQR